MKAFTLTKPAHLFAAMPLIFGLATILVTPMAQAATIDLVHIRDGFVDVNRDDFISNDDDLNNVWLWCNDAAPVRVRIIDGRVDVTENGIVNTNDDLINCDLNDEDPIGGEDVPTTDQVDFINGLVDVNEDGVVNGSDDVFFVKLFID